MMIFSGMALRQGVILQPGKHGLAGSGLMALIKGQPKGRVDAEIIVIVEVAMPVM
jgi:hypothetical protein